MRNLIRRIGSPALRPALLAAAAVALIAAGGGAASVAAGRDHTAATRSHRTDDDGVGHRRSDAKIKHGVLVVKGSHANDTIALRLKAGNPTRPPGRLRRRRVADFSFSRDRSRESSFTPEAATTACESTTATASSRMPSRRRMTVATETTRSPEAPEHETLIGGDGNDTIDGNNGNDAAFLGAGDDTFVWDPGDGSDTSKARTGTTRWSSTAPTPTSSVALSANGNRLRFFRDAGQHHDGHGRRRAGRLQRARRRRPRHRQRPERHRTSAA